MKYSGKNNNKLTKKANLMKGIYDRYLNYKHKQTVLKKEIKILEKQLKNPKNNYNKIHQLLTEKKHNLLAIEKHLSRAYKSMTALIAALSLTVGGIAYTTSNNNFKDMVEDASELKVVQNIGFENKPSKVAYEQLKNDIQRYSELSNMEDRFDFETQELKNIKSRINSNPEAVTQLSLEILKQKIANSLNIEDYDRITIFDKSTKVSASPFHNKNGTQTNIFICIDGQKIAAHEKFEPENGNPRTVSNTIPKDLLNSIKKLSVAQYSQDIGKATKSLKSSMDLDAKDINFDKKVIEKIDNLEQDNER